MIPFLASMLALLIVALWRGKGRAVAVIAVLLGNWLTQVAMIRVTGEQFPWLFFIVTDYLSALLIYATGARRWGLAVIFLYSLQIVCHGAYGLTQGGYLTDYCYYWALTYTGWGQLLVVGGWLGHDVVRRGVSVSSGASPDHAHNSGMVAAENEVDR